MSSHDQMVNIKGLNKGAVLAALYNASEPKTGVLQYDPSPMSTEKANALLAGHSSFNCLYGRVMKVDLTDDDSFDPWFYDRDLGEGAAARAVATVSPGKI